MNRAGGGKQDVAGLEGSAPVVTDVYAGPGRNDVQFVLVVGLLGVGTARRVVLHQLLYPDIRSTYGSI